LTFGKGDKIKIREFLKKLRYFTRPSKNKLYS